MTTTRSSQASHCGQVLSGRYRVGDVLGAGGMGSVYVAEEIATGRSVAVKVLLPELAESPELRARFEREAHTASFLQHPNLVEVYAMGTAEDGTPYLAMELVRGQSVADLLDHGPIHPRRALVIARQALLGLAYAHQHGVIHRDLKPDNIMVGRAGEPGREYDHVKLLDFGIVKIMTEAAAVLGWEKLTRTGVTFGTPRYMPPEQALGRPVDLRADIYALGVSLFEMLAARTPFESDEPLELLRMHVKHPPPTLASAVAGNAAWCTAAVETLVARALAKSVDQRWSSAREMIAALDAAFVSLDHLPAASD